MPIARPSTTRRRWRSASSRNSPAARRPGPGSCASGCTVPTRGWEPSVTSTIHPTRRGGPRPRRTISSLPSSAKTCLITSALRSSEPQVPTTHRPPSTTRSSHSTWMVSGMRGHPVQVDPADGRAPDLPDVARPEVAGLEERPAPSPGSTRSATADSGVRRSWSNPEAPGSFPSTRSAPRRPHAVRSGAGAHPKTAAAARTAAPWDRIGSAAPYPVPGVSRVARCPTGAGGRAQRL